MAALALRLGETLRTPLAGALLPRQLLGNYLLIVRNRTFLGFLLCVSLSFGALFTWISNSAFVVIDHFGVAPERFGWVFGAVVLGYIAGAYSGSRANALGAGARDRDRQRDRCGGRDRARARGLERARRSLRHHGAMAVSFFGAGLAIPQGTAGGLAPFPERAGSAAACSASSR